MKREVLQKPVFCAKFASALFDINIVWHKTKYKIQYGIKKILYHEIIIES